MTMSRRAFSLSSLAAALAVAAPARGATRAPKLKETPGRAPFGVSDPEVTTVAGIADARFMADIPEAFRAALGSGSILAEAPWLALSVAVTMARSVPACSPAGALPVPVPISGS
jgi:hypothetical protein